MSDTDPTRTLPPTDPDVRLGSDLELEATRCAVVEWNNLPPTRQALVRFERLVDKHRERLARLRARAGP